MSKKHLTLLLTSLCFLFVLSGCSNSSELISLETPISDVTNDGILTVILTWPLAQAINWISSKLGVFWGIALVTLALNVIILLLTFKSNVAMQKMQELQPELQKIQLKYEGRTDQASQQRMAMEMQNLYKKYGVNPMGQLAVVFLQWPVLISMYAAVRRSAAVATGTFMGASLDMTPSEAFTNKAWPLIVIFVLMIVFQFISVALPRWLQISRGKKEADKHHKHYEKPANQNAMMTYGMVIFIAIIMVSWPTALSLYYLIYSSINIIKTLVIDKMTHKEEN